MSIHFFIQETAPRQRFCKSNKLKKLAIHISAAHLSAPEVLKMKDARTAGTWQSGNEGQNNITKHHRKLNAKGMWTWLSKPWLGSSVGWCMLVALNGANYGDIQSKYLLGYRQGYVSCRVIYGYMVRNDMTLQLHCKFRNAHVRVLWWIWQCIWAHPIHSSLLSLSLSFPSICIGDVD